MAKDIPNPTIRILILGAPGAGKNCLESQFITATYPPPYDPTLTLKSRRYFTLPPTSHDHVSVIATPPIEKQRPTSTPTAVLKDGARSGINTGADEPIGYMHSISSVGTAMASSGACKACVNELRERNTYLVEVINYPALQETRVRANLHARGDYDAILLVYSIADSTSVDAVRALHAEIPLCSRMNSRHHRYRRLATGGYRISYGISSGAAVEASQVTGKTVVALVGNKSDCDEQESSNSLDYSCKKKATEGGMSYISTEVPGKDRRQNHYLVSADAGDMAGAEEHVSACLWTDEPSPISLPSHPWMKVTPPQKEDTTPWLQMEKRTMAGEVQKTGDTDNNSQNSVDTVYSSRIHSEMTTAQTHQLQRQVSTADGTALARELQLSIPLFETSARTGANIEALLERLVRDVLQEMGWSVSGEVGGRSQGINNCYHKSVEHGKEHNSTNNGIKRDSGTTSSSNKKGIRNSVIRGEPAQQPDDDEVLGGKKAARTIVKKSETTKDAAGSSVQRVGGYASDATPSPWLTQRHDSIMERVRRIFDRKQVMVTV